MDEVICRHDRIARDCMYCPLMRKTRPSEAAASALPETDVVEDDEETTLTKPRRSRGGRASLDEHEADDSSADGLGDLYSRGLRHNPRGTGEQDILSDDQQGALEDIC